MSNTCSFVQSTLGIVAQAIREEQNEQKLRVSHTEIDSLKQQLVILKTENTRLVSIETMYASQSETLAATQNELQSLKEREKLHVARVNELKTLMSQQQQTLGERDKALELERKEVWRLRAENEELLIIISKPESISKIPKQVLKAANKN